MKKIIVTVTVLSILFGGALSANAATTEGSSIEDNEIFNITEKAGGGTWSHGVNDVEVYSNYHHAEKIHGSSVVNGDEVWDRTYNIGSGCTSKASVYSTWRGNKAYYNIGYR